MQTMCLNCGVVLTDIHRKASGNFDSALPSRKPEPHITWARCDSCYLIAQLMQVAFSLYKDAALVQQWMVTPNKALGYKRPINDVEHALIVIRAIADGAYL